ncbi:hypothetical protein BGW36DRAFT_196087 [Talaromyces proteolyticus]|uniref:Uncharacterized protein n=1 Tax=Talaromyces proteolyticus TaxID=1131652 RepID=A0AAD4KMA6_9EURO|nr:uncharacterized protein BGW36DRAFT_196087 [Talaromyces proteolyticus]KAH8695041.1 hypothetical protein BGW36DRAFT_196087 [Talaromyces proteolyticus]
MWCFWSAVLVPCFISCVRNFCNLSSLCLVRFLSTCSGLRCLACSLLLYFAVRVCIFLTFFNYYLLSKCIRICLHLSIGLILDANNYSKIM